MIRVTKNQPIYVVCPAMAATGGPELLHQLVYKLNKLGFNAYMSYYFSKRQDKTQDPVHERYKHYENPYVVEVEDNDNQVIIVPEVETGFIYNYPKSVKIIWWLSVDFFFITWDAKSKLKDKFKKWFGILKRYNFEKMDNLYHLVQSYYAEDFLAKKGIRKQVGYLSDYLNKAFLDNAPTTFTATGREDIVLYNPKKGLEKVEQLQQLAPQLNWVPIQNMTPDDIVTLQQKSKVYIDFGFHPGKDRIPREAAINGCCVITGREGAANYEKDVPIKDEYKFEFSVATQQAIVQKIEECLSDYEMKITDFEGYRTMILNEEQQFEQDILKNFVK